MNLEYMTAKVRNVNSVESISVHLESDAEKMMLSELGFPTNINDFKLGDAVVLIQHLAQQGVTLDQRAREIVRERGYEWRREQSLQDIQPTTALYLDAYARLNEIYTEHARMIRCLDDKVYQEDRERQKIIKDIIQRTQK